LTTLEAACSSTRRAEDPANHQLPTQVLKLVFLDKKNAAFLIQVSVKAGQDRALGHCTACGAQL